MSQAGRPPAPGTTGTLEEGAPAGVASPALAHDAMVVVSELVKRYPSRPVNAVDGVSFSVAGGEVMGLLGPNGAGKTTTVGILTTRVRLTGGRALVAGIDVATDPVAARRRLAVVPQRMNLDRALSARRNLLFHAAYFGMSGTTRSARADALLEEFGLADRAHDRVDRLSGGQVQRLMIARALMHEPRVIFLDEPTTGLDPQARLFVWDRIEGLRRQGVTVVLTTHDMDEASALADRVGIMDHGRLLALDTPEALTALVPGRSTLALAATLPAGLAAGGPAGAGTAGTTGAGTSGATGAALQAALAGLAGVKRVEAVADEQPSRWGPGSEGRGAGSAPQAPQAPGGVGPEATTLRLRLYCAVEAATLVGPVAQVVLAQGAELSDVRLGQPSLEDVFIHLTGRALRG